MSVEACVDRDIPNAGPHMRMLRKPDYSGTSPLDSSVNRRSCGGGDGLAGLATAARFLQSQRCDEATLPAEHGKVATPDDTSP
jgi:hypothetical protein